MSKHYYAADHRYGIEFCNDYDTLYRFDSKAERDAYVEYSNFNEAGAYGGYRTEAVTRTEARRHFANAFRTFDCHDQTDERDWLRPDDEAYEYWNINNIDGCCC